MKKPSMIRRFFSFLLRIIVVAALMVIIAVGSFEGVTYYLTGSLYDLRDIGKNHDLASALDDSVKAEQAKIDDENTKSTLFFVESQDGLTRYTFLNIMNISTGAADVLLIPLHAQVNVGGDLLTKIQKQMPGAGSTLEIDDIARAYGEDKYPIITDVFAQILGITIDGYDVMSQDQFETLLNITDPVTYHFSDTISYRNSKKVLNYIDAGDQELDGKMAMILIGYLDGSDKQESNRLENSSAYFESWFGQIIRSRKGTDLISQIQNKSSSSEGRDYSEELKLWDRLPANALTLRILQGAESNGVFTIDSQKARLQLTTLLKQSAEYNSSGDQDSVASLGDEYGSTESSKEYFIELYNAAFQQGLASSWESYLESEGYNISLISNYQDEGPIATTRIIVSQEGIGMDLLQYFPGADIQTGEIDTGGDIQVFIGTDSINVGKTDGNDTADSGYDDTEDALEGGLTTGYDSSGDAQEEPDSTVTGNGSGYYNFDTDSE